MESVGSILIKGVTSKHYKLSDQANQVFPRKVISSVS